MKNLKVVKVSILKGGFSMELTEQAKEAKRAYYRDYYKRNKEKCKKAKEKYWESKANKKLKEINKECNEVV